MNRLSKLAAVATVLPILGLSSMAYATGGGQIEQGDIYRAENVTSSGSFADNINAACGDTVAFRVRIHNGGPDTITNVKVSATLNSSSSTSHGSQVSVNADNNLNNMTVTANAGVNSSQATTAAYVSGSTELLNYSATPGDESVLQTLPDGILSGGINVGSIGPLTTDTEEVQFEVLVSCPTTPQNFTSTQTVSATASASANATANCPKGDVASATSASASASATASASASATSTVSQADADSKAKALAQSQALSKAQAAAQATAQASAQAAANAKCTVVTTTPPPTTTTTTSVQAATTTALPNTGPGDEVGELFAGTSALGAAGHYLIRRFRR